MVEKNELRISADNSSLFIDVQVPDNDMYADVNIYSIAFVNQNNYVIGYPTDSSKIDLEITRDFPITEYAITDTKHYIATIPKTLLDLKDNMYFVYILTDGIPSGDPGCGCDENPTMYVAVNMLPLQSLKCSYINSYICNCEENRANLLDLIVKEDVFNNAIIMKDYTLAIKIYNEILLPDFKKVLKLYPGRGKSGINSCKC